MITKPKLNQILTEALAEIHASGQAQRPHPAVRAELAGLLIHIIDIEKLMSAEDVLIHLRAKMESAIMPVKKLSEMPEI